MRSQLLDYVDTENGKDLKPIVVSAIRVAPRQIIVATMSIFV